MKTVLIQNCPGFEEWRNAARKCLIQNLSPDLILWQDKTSDFQNDLFARISDEKRNCSEKIISIPKAFIEKASVAICYKSEDRFDFLYRLLWRIVYEDKNLLLKINDDDIIQFGRMLKAVYRDAYKIKAYVRFREIIDNDEPLYISWYEPEHYSLEIPLNFFTTRFANMRWVIITPYKAVYWDKMTLRFCNNPDPALFPKEDRFEEYWCTYYASIFNPARVKRQAMLNQMPKKYWKNMPETKLIDGLLKDSRERVNNMFKNQD